MRIYFKQEDKFIWFYKWRWLCEKREKKDLWNWIKIRRRHISTRADGYDIHNDNDDDYD